ncbi:MAG: hypothetical protein AVDCRST_MAG36-1300, partial [uncultured Nocardioidaceae bacterium]
VLLLQQPARLRRLPAALGCRHRRPAPDLRPV